MSNGAYKWGTSYRQNDIVDHHNVVALTGVPLPNATKLPSGVIPLHAQVTMLITDLVSFIFLSLFESSLACRRTHMQVIRVHVHATSKEYTASGWLH